MRGFVYGKPVMGESFVGREETLRQIETLIGSGQSVILTGLGRLESLLLEAQRRAKNRLTGNVDLFTITTGAG